MYARETCPNCGTRPDDWDPALGGDRDRYVADVDYCEGCARLAELSRQLSDGGQSDGVRPVLITQAELARRVAAEVEQETARQKQEVRT